LRLPNGRFGKKDNNVIKIVDDYLEIDVSTKKHPNCTLFFDKEAWEYILSLKLGRTYAQLKYKELYARANKIKGSSEVVTSKCPYLHTLLIKGKNDLVVDHINRNTLDCRQSNLRLITHSRSLINRELKTNTGIKRVHKRKDGLFEVNFGSNSGLFRKYFKDKEEAINTAEAVWDKNYNVPVPAVYQWMPIQKWIGSIHQGDSADEVLFMGVFDNEAEAEAAVNKEMLILKQNQF
jgi:hypothetical protein